MHNQALHEQMVIGNQDLEDMNNLVSPVKI